MEQFPAHPVCRLYVEYILEQITTTTTTIISHPANMCDMFAHRDSIECNVAHAKARADISIKIGSAHSALDSFTYLPHFMFDYYQPIALIYWARFAQRHKISNIFQHISKCN